MACAEVYGGRSSSSSNNDGQGVVEYRGKLGGESEEKREWRGGAEGVEERDGKRRRGVEKPYHYYHYYYNQYYRYYHY